MFLNERVDEVKKKKKPGLLQQIIKEFTAPISLLLVAVL